MDEKTDVAETVADPSQAPEWSPIPIGVARAFLQRHKDAKLEVVFPEVYEEDRSIKIKDLATANGLAVIAHQRMADQIAKELGFEEYDYTSEQQAIKMEQPTVAPGALGVADQIARSTVGFGRPGSGPPEQVEPVVAGNGNLPPGKRDEVSGAATAAFRHQQRQVETAVHAMTEAVHELTRLVQSGVVERATEATGVLVAAALQRLTETMATLDLLVGKKGKGG